MLPMTSSGGIRGVGYGADLVMRPVFVINQGEVHLQTPPVQECPEFVTLALAHAKYVQKQALKASSTTTECSIA